MDFLGPIVGAVTGGLGGAGVGRGPGGMGGIGRIITGVIGGGGLALLLSQFAGSLGPLGQFFGGGGADAAGAAASGFDIKTLVGGGASGLVGGPVLSGILNKVMKKG